LSQLGTARSSGVFMKAVTFCLSMMTIGRMISFGTGCLRRLRTAAVIARYA
jgi:hypothetical protein